ncbi:MAG: N-acetylglucosamine-6-phosphate deacetylase [Eubacteriales bacterium]|nr:N-acetylglucosamine-6-phosphate deacetylase [Eubacteriales bacterium]
MIIKNGSVLNENFEFKNIDILTDGAIIKRMTENIEGDNVLDAEDLLVLPGFIDTHFHGAVGKDFFMSGNEAYEDISAFEAKNGTTAIMPTLSSTPYEKTLEAIRHYVETKNNAPGARYIGLHLEGPFLSSARLGAMVGENVRKPSIDELNEYVKAGEGSIKVITIAPEIEDAEETIAFALENGITVSMGHTDASYDQAEKAVLWGVTRSTHTYNAMSPLNHREPNAVGCALTNDNIDCELICDFFHIHPKVCKLTFDVKGSDRIIMITDSEVGAGLPDGEFVSAEGNKLIIKDRQTRLPDGTISGGSSCLIDGIKNMVSVGVRIEDAVKAATINPARSVGLDNEIGSLKEGKFADIVICDAELNIKYVIVDGKIVYGGEM